MPISTEGSLNATITLGSLPSRYGGGVPGVMLFCTTFYLLSYPLRVTGTYNPIRYGTRGGSK